MLIRFSVENFLSYKDSQVFSMAAGRQSRHNDHVIEAKGKKILKGSFFFGANASGKSNLFEAVRFARDVISFGLKKSALAGKHFRAEQGYAAKPGVFQFDIYSNGHYYSYGFAVSYQRTAVTEEWLYLCDAGECSIFERTVENGKTCISSEYRFSDDLQKQAFSIYSENVPDDRLLLTEISERKLIGHADFATFKDVSMWFKQLVLISPQSSYLDKVSILTENNQYNLARLLNEFDTGIENISLDLSSAEDVLDFLPGNIRTEVLQNIETGFAEDESVNEINLNIGGKSIHFTKKDNQIFASQLMMDHGNADDLFEFRDESDGTKRLFDLIPVYRMGLAPHVIFVDELDRSFHTQLAIAFIRRFYEVTAGRESQLIATVHDSNIMDLDLLRQDEIWFVERQTDHSSRIYSLNKFKARFDKKVAKDYLLGRYGAVPCFTQSMTELEDDNYGNFTSSEKSDV